MGWQKGRVQQYSNWISLGFRLRGQGWSGEVWGEHSGYDKHWGDIITPKINLLLSAC